MSRKRAEPFVPPEEDDGYRGPAQLLHDGAVVAVDVHLAHHFEPLDGRTHWYGRIQRSDDVCAVKDAGATVVRLAIADREAEVRLAEYDAWGNVAVAGVGRPPYEG